VSVQFPKEEYVFTLAEAAKGVRFEYRVVVRRDLEGVIPRAQDMGRAAGPGSSGLCPFEKISGDGQSYSPADIGLGQPKDSPRRIEKGTHLLSFDWDGKNWAGASDTSNPKGPPFPPGTYRLTVQMTGEVLTPDGRRPYEISRSASVRLVQSWLDVQVTGCLDVFGHLRHEGLDPLSGDVQLFVVQPGRS
jgi:hypothetical protein